MIAVRPRNALRACTARPAGRRAVRARDRPLAASAARDRHRRRRVVRARRATSRTALARGRGRVRAAVDHVPSARSILSRSL